MALSKQQAYALYFLLVSESSLVQNLRAANCTSSQTFVAALQQQVNQLEPGTVVDNQLGNLYSGNNPSDGSTLIDQNPVSILNSLSMLAGEYGGGPCPTAAEQPKAWSVLKAVP